MFYLASGKYYLGRDNHWSTDHTCAAQYVSSYVAFRSLMKSIKTIHSLKLARHSTIYGQFVGAESSRPYETEHAYSIFLQHALNMIGRHKELDDNDKLGFGEAYSLYRAYNEIFVNAMKVEQFDFYLEIQPQSYVQFLNGRVDSQTGQRRVSHRITPHRHVYEDFYDAGFKAAPPRMVYGAFLFFDTPEQGLLFKLASEGDFKAKRFKGPYMVIDRILKGKI